MSKDLSEYQDVIGQLAQKIYTPISLCFPLRDASSQSQIIDTLTKGLKGLSISFPWLAGQIIIEGGADGNTGRPKIIPLDKTSHLIVKGFTHDAVVPSMDTLRKANFPSTMLEGTVFMSLKGLPTIYGESEDDPAPVFFLQVNSSTVASSSTSPANTAQCMGMVLAKSSKSSPKLATMKSSQTKNYFRAIVHATTSFHYWIKPPTNPVPNSIICS